MSMTNRDLIILSVVIFSAAVMSFFGWNYTEAIKEQNLIEREKIESTERMKQAELEQRLSEKEFEFQKKAEQDRIEAEQSAEVNFREECKKVQDENSRGYEEFINNCTRGNSIDFCLASEGGHIFEEVLAPDWVQKCVASKKETGW